MSSKKRLSAPYKKVLLIVFFYTLSNVINIQLPVILVFFLNYFQYLTSPFTCYFDHMFEEDGNEDYTPTPQQDHCGNGCYFSQSFTSMLLLVGFLQETTIYVISEYFCCEIHYVILCECSI